MRADPRLGTELAGHRVVAVIGRGGMAVVYLAEHLRLGRRVALKVLDPEMAEDEGFRERFIRESRIAAGLDHPNVVTVYDAGEAEGVLYISMRYVEGTDLERLLRAEIKLEPPRAVSIVSQCAAALDAAHAEGLVHRDVKPANILLASEGRMPGDRVYLSDFGVTKRLHSGAGLTRTGQFVGTVDYVAPEQIRGEDVDGRADVYSLGCVLFRCLTGGVPFPRETEVGTIYAHLEDDPPSVSELSPTLAEVGDVVARAMAKSRDDRFATCRELALAAGHAVGAPAPAQEPAARTPAGAPPGARSRARHARRRSVAVVSGAVVAGVAVLTGAALLFGLLRSPPESGGPTGLKGSPSVPVAPPKLSWTPVPDVRNVLGGPQNQAVSAATKVDGTLVAVGHDESGGTDDAAVWTSSNATRWERVRGDAFVNSGDERMDGVAVVDGLVVAVGAEVAGGDTDAAAWTSSDDGSTWQRIDSPTSGLHDLGNQLMHRVVRGPEGLLAVGHVVTNESIDARVWKSGNGTDWTSLTTPSFGGPDHEEMFDAAVLGGDVFSGGFLTTDAGDRDAAIWVESGGGWSMVDQDSLRGPGNQQINAVLQAGPGLVAVGTDDAGGDVDAAVWTSTDGQTWNRVPHVEATFGGRGTQWMSALSVFGSAIIAAGYSETAAGDSNGAIWLSTDGTTWTRQGPIASSPLGGQGRQRINGLVVMGQKLVAVGSETRAFDDQGAVWIGKVESA
jgi:tRNA A-37 threonylcarbamoyl transferase component Bud32